MDKQNHQDKQNSQSHISFYREKEGSVDLYMLAPGINISFNRIYTDSWTKGDSSIFSPEMLIFNFCLHGRCDVSLAQKRYAIVSEGQVCASTILPSKDFYYPGRLYEGVQIYIDRTVIRQSEGTDFLSLLGIHTEQMVEMFCKKNGLYLRRMNDRILALVRDIWDKKKDPELGFLRYALVRILHEVAEMPSESESDVYFTRSQIAIVREAEALIMQDLSKRITAKEMAQRFGISESSFKLYVKGILGDSYLNYFRRKRMESAAKLLASTNRKVIEIANAVGYENQGKFAKAFAQIYGVTPMEFRRLGYKSGLLD